MPDTPRGPFLWRKAAFRHDGQSCAVYVFVNQKTKNWWAEILPDEIPADDLPDWREPHPCFKGEILNEFTERTPKMIEGVAEWLSKQVVCPFQATVQWVIPDGDIPATRCNEMRDWMKQNCAGRWIMGGRYRLRTGEYSLERELNEAVYGPEVQHVSFELADDQERFLTRWS